MIIIHLLHDGGENMKIYDLFLQRKSYLPRATAERNMIFFRCVCKSLYFLHHHAVKCYFAKRRMVIKKKEYIWF